MCFHALELKECLCQVSKEILWVSMSKPLQAFKVEDLKKSALGLRVANSMVTRLTRERMVVKQSRFGVTSFMDEPLFPFVLWAPHNQ